MPEQLHLQRGLLRVHRLRREPLASSRSAAAVASSSSSSSGRRRASPSPLPPTCPLPCRARVRRGHALLLDARDLVLRPCRSRGRARPRVRSTHACAFTKCFLRCTVISQSWRSGRARCCSSEKSTSTRPASWVKRAMRATFSRASASSRAGTGRFLPRTTMSICTSHRSAHAAAATSIRSAESTVDVPGGGVRAAVTATHDAARRAARSADAAARERGAGGGDVVDERAPTAGTAAARDEARADPAARGAGEPGLRRARARGRAGRTQPDAAAGGRPPGRGARRDRSPAPATVRRLVGAQVTTAAPRPSTPRHRSDHRAGQPRHDRAGVAVLDPGHELTGDALVGERRAPGVDPGAAGPRPAPRSRRGSGRTRDAPACRRNRGTRAGTGHRARGDAYDRGTTALGRSVGSRNPATRPMHVSDGTRGGRDTTTRG